MSICLQNNFRLSICKGIHKSPRAKEGSIRNQWHCVEYGSIQRWFEFTAISNQCKICNYCTQWFSNSIRINDYYRIGKGHVFHGNLARLQGEGLGRRQATEFLECMNIYWLNKVTTQDLNLVNIFEAVGVSSIQRQGPKNFVVIAFRMFW